MPSACRLSQTLGRRIVSVAFATQSGTHMAEQHTGPHELGRQIALLPFQNSSLRSFIRDELTLLDSLGVPHLRYHEERVTLCMAAAAFGIRAYLAAGDLSDEVSAGFASFLRDYGASAPERQTTVQLLQKRVGGYGYAAAMELLPSPERPSRGLADEFALVLSEHSQTEQLNTQTARDLAERYLIPLWHQGVKNVGLAMKAAGLPIQER
jgi:hypothetical protein